MTPCSRTGCVLDATHLVILESTRLATDGKRYDAALCNVHFNDCLTDLDPRFRLRIVDVSMLPPHPAAPTTTPTER